MNNNNEITIIRCKLWFNAWMHVTENETWAYQNNKSIATEFANKAVDDFDMKFATTLKLPKPIEQ